MSIRIYEENGKKLYEVYVNGTDSRGGRVQRKRKNIESMPKAKNIEFELKRELSILKDEVIPYRWGEWLVKCLHTIKMSKSPSTYLNYDKSLNKWATPVWKDIEMRAITKTKVYSLIFDELDTSLSLGTRKTVLKMVRRIFEMAVDDGLIDRNPCSGVQVRVPEIEQTVLTNTEVEVFLREAKLCNHRFFPIWYVALMTGMRSGELMALTWKDIDFEAKIISVSKQWSKKHGFSSTKTQKSRVVPISEDLLNFLKGLTLKVVDSEFVLPRLVEWLNGDQALVTGDFCESIGVSRIKFHDLRATFITNLLSRGVSLAKVMAIVGHSQLKTTNGYLRKAGVEVRGATDELGYKMPSIGAMRQVLSIVR